MAIKFITGVPGGGKSMLAVRLITEELRTGSRDICTNLPLHIGRLCEFMVENYGKSFSAATRIRILKDSEVSDFYKHRGIGVEVSERNPITINHETVAHLNYSPIARDRGGVLYLLDEAHIFFNARNWADIAKDCLFYVSQHRHLNDDVYLITQRLKNVDAQFRDITQEYIQMTNRRMQKWGPWQAPGGFVAKIYPKPPTNAPGETPMETWKFNLDARGLGSCYDTSAGVGLEGGIMADTKRKRKGLPFWTMPIAACLVLGLVGCGIHYGVQGAKAVVSNTLAGTSRVATNTVFKPKPLLTVQPPTDRPTVERVPSARDAIPLSPMPEKPTVTGYVVSTSQGVPMAYLTLSDGSTLKKGEWYVQNGEYYIFATGEKLEKAKTRARGEAARAR